MRSKAGTPRLLGLGRMWPCRTLAVTHAVPHFKGARRRRRSKWQNRVTLRGS